MQPPNQAPPPDKERIKKEVLRLIQDYVDQDASFEKSWQLSRLRKCDLYNRGLQHLQPTVNNGVYGWVPVERGAVAGTGDVDDSEIFDDYNIDLIQTYRRRWEAALGLRPFWNCKAVPDDPQSETDRKAARQADIAKLWLHEKWQASTKNIQLASKQWRAGTAWIYTPCVASGKLFGTSEQPVIENTPKELFPAQWRCIQCGHEATQPSQNPIDDSPACPSCLAPVPIEPNIPAQTINVPEQVGTRTYENAGSMFYLYDGFTVTVPFYATDLEDAMYLLCETEEHKAKLLAVLPELREMVDAETLEIKPDQHSSTASEQEGLLARAGRESIMGGGAPDSKKQRWTMSRYWLNSSIYELVREKDLRDYFKANYQRGLKVTLVDRKVVRYENEAAEDVWTPCFPAIDDYLWRDPISWYWLGLQDVWNDSWMIGIATLERGLPSHIVDKGLLNVDALNNRRYMPQEIVETINSFGSTLESRIKTLPTARFPDQLIPLAQAMEQHLQNGTGLLPPIWGGWQVQNETASAAKDRLNQALQQVGVPGLLITMAWTTATYKAIQQMVEHAPDNMSITAAGQTEMLDFDVLRKGKYHFEGHPGVPQSYAERRDTLNQLIRENPEVSQQIGVGQPSNAGSVKDYLGLPDIKTPNEDLREKMLETIQELLEQQPVPNPDGSFAPSLQPDPFTDDPAIGAQLIREWLISLPGRKIKRDNDAGYQNVRAFGMALDFLAKQAMMAAPPPGEEAPPPVTGPEQITDQTAVSTMRG